MGSSSNKNLSSSTKKGINQIDGNKNPIVDSNVKNKVSFRCTYEIKDYNEIRIINYSNGDFINEEILTKIKILNSNKKEELIFKKKFNKLGYNTIDFIIEENLNDMSCMFSGCSSLKKSRIYIY